MHLIEERVQETDVQIDLPQTHSPKRVIFIDGMAVLNKINISSDIKICADLKSVFSSKVLVESFALVRYN